jgi:hypothetical protein
MARTRRLPVGQLAPWNVHRRHVVVLQSATPRATWCCSDGSAHNSGSRGTHRASPLRREGQGEAGDVEEDIPTVGDGVAAKSDREGG